MYYVNYEEWRWVTEIYQEQARDYFKSPVFQDCVDFANSIKNNPDYRNVSYVLGAVSRED